MLRGAFGLLAAGVLLLSLATAHAQEWTRFRGPNGTGISDARNIPTTWTADDYNWKVELPAAGHSSPVLWADRIFLTGADDKTATRSVFCLRANDGKLLWSKEFKSQHHRRHQLNSFASATPALDAERVYVAWSTPDEYTLLALSHEGDTVWQRDLGPFVSQHSCGISPIVVDDLVILGNDQDKEDEKDTSLHGKSYLIAVDARTGETQWKLDRDSAVVAYSTPCLHRTRDGGSELIFNSQAHGITAVDPRSGSVNWEVRDLFDKRSCSSPVVADGNLIIGTCGSGGGGNYVVAVKPGTAGEANSGSLAYKIDKQAPYVPTPIAKGDLLFLWSDNGIVSAVRAKTGEPLWQKRVGGTYYGSPVCVDDHLYCINTAGEVVVLRAGEEFEELGRNPLGEMSHSTPAVADGRMYLRTYKHLVSLGRKTPTKR
ncbi:MAG TPA: PQQ-binding-like beta-propeller repeat protein [Planctomycetaceae bacterium]|nr:PQQ-binding-like beta-propeller repeat protein [Planctomycetaceae bacterium]